MDPIEAFDQLLRATGHPELVPIVAAIGAVVVSITSLASALATVYPQTWRGAGLIHKLALLVGKAKPAAPASPVPTVALISPAIGTEVPGSTVTIPPVPKQ